MLQRTISNGQRLCEVLSLRMPKTIDPTTPIRATNGSTASSGTAVADHAPTLDIRQRLRDGLVIDLAGDQHIVDRFHQRVGYGDQGALMSDLRF